jgi:hypothetical protein
MDLQQAREQDRIIESVLRRLLPFGLVFGVIGAGITMNNRSNDLYELCVGGGAHPDACALRIYGR